MNYYIICPFCGYQLLKGNDVTLEILCPRCKEKFNIEIKGKTIELERITASSDNDEE